MSTRPLSLVTLVACLSFSARPLQAEKIEPEKVPALLDALSVLEAQIRQAGAQRNFMAMEHFRAAAASEKDAIEFYLKCYKELYFTRDDAKEADWRTWRDRNEARLKDKGFALALKLQLQYLILTLQVQEADDIGTMIPSISRFIESIAASLEILGDQIRILREPVIGSVFAKVYMLDQTLELGDWASAPLNLPEMFGKTIIPYLVKNRPDQVSTAWDSRIRFEHKLVEFEESPALELKFQTEILPDLRWQKAQDLFDAGLETTAVENMLATLKAHPTHPSAPTWLRELRSILEVAVYPNPKVPDPVTPAPTAPAPPALNPPS